MKAWRAWGFAAAVGVLVTAPPAGAHHAIIAEYEMSVTKAFTGVMTRFAVINPHVRWFFVETKPDGTKVEWEMSGAGPGALRAAGLMRIFKVGEQYVPPSPEAAAAILEASPETDDPGRYVFTYDLERDTTAEGTYPIVLVSYEMACTQYAKAQDAAVVKPFLAWIVSEEGQQAAAAAAGSAPLSAAIRAKIQPAIDAIGS